MIAISVLDQAPRRSGGPPGHALGDSLTLARHVDGLGFRRFWIAEHHAFAAISIAAPEVVIAHIAAHTHRLRIGSGGVLLPNRRPLQVAEQFCTLEGLYPGRIDLGIGRSEGTVDPATVEALGRPQDTAHGPGYDRQLDELLSFGGVRPLPAGRSARRRARGADRRRAPAHHPAGLDDQLRRDGGAARLRLRVRLAHEPGRRGAGAPRLPRELRRPRARATSPTRCSR